jgi:hypothetical protein
VVRDLAQDHDRHHGTLPKPEKKRFWKRLAEARARARARRRLAKESKDAKRASAAARR